MRYQIASLVAHDLSFLKFHIFMEDQQLSQSSSNMRPSGQYFSRGQFGSNYQSSKLTSVDKDGWIQSLNPIHTKDLGHRHNGKDIANMGHPLLIRLMNLTRNKQQIVVKNVEFAKPLYRTKATARLASFLDFLGGPR